MPIVHSGNH